jgi:hypothetical protein
MTGLIRTFGAFLGRFGTKIAWKEAQKVALSHLELSNSVFLEGAAKPL